jgi:Gpi18-like mannosyltransferase
MDKADRQAQFASLAVLFIPFAVMNGALWKQCDAVYTSFAVISIYYLLKKDYSRSFLFYALSFAFKLQAVFLLPLYLIVYFCRNDFSILQFLQVPFVYFIAGIPAVIMKKGLKATYFTYLEQTDDSSGNLITNSSCSIYRFGMKSLEIMKLPAILVTLTIFIATAGFIWWRKENLQKEGILYLAGWSALTCYMFLPEMHERYDYAAVIILTALCLYCRRNMLLPLVTMIFCTTIAYSLALQPLWDFSSAHNTLIVISILYAFSYFYITYDFVLYYLGKIPKQLLH